MHPGARPRPPLALPLISSPRRAGGGTHDTAGVAGAESFEELLASIGGKGAEQEGESALPRVAQTARLPRCVDHRIVAHTARNPHRVVGVTPSAPPPPSTSRALVISEESTVAVVTAADDEADFASLLPNDNLGAAAATARRAFREQAAKYKAILAAKDAEIAALKAADASTTPGGQQYMLLQDELEWTQGEMRSLQTKVNSLVKLLDRAGATIRLAEERRAFGQGPSSSMGDGLNHGASSSVASGGLQRLDWGPMRGVMKDLFLQGRPDNHIIATIAQYIQKLTAQINTLESASEGNSSRVAEVESRKEALIRTIHQNQKEIEDLRDELVRTRRSGFGGEGGADIESMRQEFEQERAKLLHQVTSLETAMRNTVDTRPFFVALGKGVSVPPFLRHDGRVRNSPLSKPIVENMIISLWLTRFVPTLEGCPALEEAGLTADVRRRGAKAILDVFDSTAVLSRALERMFAVDRLFSKKHLTLGGGAEPPRLSLGGTALPPAKTNNGAGGSSSSNVGLIDYDNLALWSIRRADVRKLLSFQDHVARFFVELCRPDRMNMLFTSYTSARGVATPPVSDVARQARATLLLCAPQGSSLLRPAATMPPEVAEITYALMDGCDRYSFDADIELFRRIVKNQLPESAFFDQMIMLQKLRVALLQSAIVEREEVAKAAGLSPAVGPPQRPNSSSTRRSSKRQHGGRAKGYDDSEDGEGTEEGGGTDGSDADEGGYDGLGDFDVESNRPTVSSVLRMLRRFFPAKSADEFRLLQRALLLDLGAISLNKEVGGGLGANVMRGPLEGMGTVSAGHLALIVDVGKLFSSNDSGNQGYFLEAVRNQHVEGLSTYMAEVQCAILSFLNAATGGDSPASSPTKPRTSSLPPSGGARRDDGPGRGRRASRSALVLGLQQVGVVYIRDKLAEIDPMKPRTDINLYLYHLLQLLYGDRSRLNAPDADLIHKSCEDWFEAPLCFHPINLEELARYCPLVLCKRCGPATPPQVAVAGGAAAAQSDGRVSQSK